jgi:hypothetical protein
MQSQRASRKTRAAHPGDSPFKQLQPLSRPLTLVSVILYRIEVRCYFNNTVSVDDEIAAAALQICNLCVIVGRHNFFIAEEYSWPVKPQGQAWYLPMPNAALQATLLQHGSGNLPQPPTTRCTMARAFPPSRTIALQLSLRCKFDWRSGEGAAILVLFTRCRWCEGASTHAGLPARGWADAVHWPMAAGVAGSVEGQS